MDMYRAENVIVITNYKSSDMKLMVYLFIPIYSDKL